LPRSLLKVTARGRHDQGPHRRRREQGEGRIEVINLERTVAVPLDLRRVERIGDRLRAGAGALDQLDPQTVGARRTTVRTFVGL
jgi:hypothetical protein